MLFQYYGSTGTGVFQTLIDWGLVDAILPFALIFVLVFAILQKIQLFGERRINGVLSFVISAMIVIPHLMGYYPPASDPINMINNFLPQTAVLLLAVLCVLLLLGLAGAQYPTWTTGAVGLFAAGLLVFVILTSIMPGFFGTQTFGFLQDPALQALLIMLLVMGLIGYFVIREPQAPGAAKESFMDEWLFKKR